MPGRGRPSLSHPLLKMGACAASATVKTFEENADNLRDIVRRRGWAVLMVEPPPGGVGWAYTIGLHLSYGHPELLVVDD